MFKNLFFSSLLLGLSLVSLAQAPDLINYQAAVRNSSGEVLSNSKVTLRLSITKGNSASDMLYQETHEETTTPQGLVNVQIGSGTVGSGDFSEIDWQEGAKYLKLEIQEQGSGTFTDMGTQRLVSVPYSKYAGNTDRIANKRVSRNDPANGQILKWDGNSWMPSDEVTEALPVGNAGGDLTGTYPNPTIADHAVTAVKLHQMGAADKQILRWNGSSSTWEPADEGGGYWRLSGDMLEKISGTKLNLGWTSDASGSYATAMGRGTKATGENATTVGNKTTASGKNSIAMGEGAIASGNSAASIGMSNTASGDASIALGMYSTASGSSSLSMGRESSASGDFSIAMGSGVSATNYNAFAIGDLTLASGENSFAMGSQSKTLADNSLVKGSHVVLDAAAKGSVYLADASRSYSTIETEKDPNKFYGRFANGYSFYTNATGGTGAELRPGATSWTSISDKRKKMNFKQADGAYFLESIEKMSLGSWNYVWNDNKQRNYGPMAQDFFKYFGNDGIGNIGSDTTINSGDVDGVMMIAIQQLIKENKELKNQNKFLSEQAQKLEFTVNSHEESIRTLMRANADMLNRIEAMEANVLHEQKISVKK